MEVSREGWVGMQSGRKRGGIGGTHLQLDLVPFSLLFLYCYTPQFCTNKINDSGLI